MSFRNNPTNTYMGFLCFSPRGEAIWTKAKQKQTKSSADIPIRISGRIIKIPIEETRISSIIRITTQFRNLLQHSIHIPLYL